MKPNFFSNFHKNAIIPVAIILIVLGSAFAIVMSCKEETFAPPRIAEGY